MVSEQPAATGARRLHDWRRKAGGCSAWTCWALELPTSRRSPWTTASGDDRWSPLSSRVQRPAVLLGNSGALTALTAAVLQPKLIRAVVAAPLPDPALIQPIPSRRSPWRRRWQRRLLGLVGGCALELLVPLIARTGLLRSGLQGAYHQSIASDQELLQLIARPARRPTAARALRAMSLGMPCDRGGNGPPC